MLKWNTTLRGEKTFHVAETAITKKAELKLACEACTEKMIGTLIKNIQDDSLYLLFEWDVNTATLSVVVTDASKQQDAPEHVACVFLELERILKQLPVNEFEAQAADYADWIKFWLHDYLSSCTAFFNFSLVAIFHSSSREYTELL